MPDAVNPDTFINLWVQYEHDIKAGKVVGGEKALFGAHPDMQTGRLICAAMHRIWDGLNNGKDVVLPVGPDSYFKGLFEKLKRDFLLTLEGMYALAFADSPYRGQQDWAFAGWQRERTFVTDAIARVRGVKMLEWVKPPEPQ